MRSLLRENSSRAILLALAACLVLAGSSVPSVSHAAASTTTAGPGLLIPLYIYPGSAWTTVIQQKTAHPSVPVTVIINPDSGPGSSFSSTYGTWITQLRDAGITVLGYVYTSYGARSTSSVEADIATYKQWYSVNGIFLDEMTNQPGHESYYSALTSYAHSEGLPLVVGNPGASLPAGYVGTVDVLLIFENGYIPTASTLQTSTMGDAPSDFAIVSYDVASLSSSAVSMISQYSSYIYVTNGVSPNPYSSLPSYFSTLVADLQPSSFSVTVNSVTPSGASLNGMYTLVYYNGTAIDDGFTPLSYTGTGGNQYTVCVDNYQNYVFSHWQDGLTSSCRTLGLSSDLTLTATYSTSGSTLVARGHPTNVLEDNSEAHLYTR